MHEKETRIRGIENKLACHFKVTLVNSFTDDVLTVQRFCVYTVATAVSKLNE